MTSEIRLEVPCQECQGEKGYWSHDNRYVRCGFCNGSGFAPTELGEKILALMRHCVTIGIDKLRLGHKPKLSGHDYQRRLVTVVSWTAVLFAFVIGMLAMRIGDELAMLWRQW